MPKSHNAHLVATLVYDELCTFEFAIAQEVMSLTPPDGVNNLYDFRTFSTSGNSVRAQGGLTVTPDHDLEILRTAHTLLIPGWDVDAEAPDPMLVRAIRAAEKRGIRLVSICTGAFLFASMGLLDGQRATTHWVHAEKFRARFPNVEFMPEVLYVDDGNILSSAGAAAGLDLLFHIVQKDFGAGIANAVARRLVVPAHRDGGQQQYIDTPLPEPRDTTLSALIDEIRIEPGRDWSLSYLSDAAGMSPRTFSRRFVEATGTSPGKWLLSERIRAARLMLEETDAPLSDVALKTGFGSFENFARRFKARVGVSPNAYRKSFQQKNTTGAKVCAKP